MSALPAGSTVAIFGAGAMGAGIAQVAAQAGHRVQLFDARINAAEDAKRRIADTFASLAAKGRLSEADAKSAGARVTAVHALGDVASAKIVIEAIVEDLEAKRELFRELEVVVGTDTILATNTSSLSVTALAAGLKRPGRVVGMHFFNPAPVLPLVEIVSGLATDRGVAQTVYDTAVAWGKTPVHATSTPGFIVNRCARPFYAEALRRPGLMEALQREYRVMLAGPTTLLATLNSLQMGFRTLALEKRSVEVWEVLGAVKTEFQKFGDALAKTRKKLDEASSSIEMAERRSRVMARELRAVEALPESRAQALLPMPTDDELAGGEQPA